MGPWLGGDDMGEGGGLGVCWLRPVFMVFATAVFLRNICIC